MVVTPAIAPGRATEGGGRARKRGVVIQSIVSSTRLWLKKASRRRLSANPRELIRRATFDLTGLPPTPEEVERFLADLTRADAPASAKGRGSEQRVQEGQAYEELVDRLLASPRYGEHFGRDWLDVVRFGESTGFEVNHV